MEIVTTSSDEILVQFTGHLRPFRLRQYHCDNPDCPCNEVTLEFVEVEKDGCAISSPIRFFFSLNLETWQKQNDMKHSEQINALVDEFLNDLSDEMKARFQEERESTRQLYRKLATFTMPVEEINEGRLVSFSEVLSDKADYDGWPAYGFKFASEGQVYLINDLYCPNPRCKCNKVNLMFLAYSEKPEESAALSEVFLAELSFDGKKLNFPELTRCSESQARKLVREWQQAEPDVLDRIKWRYKAIRKAAKRILKNNRKSIPTRIQTIAAPSQTIPISNLETDFSNNFKVGRNDLCPCGSGQKYKKCCGKVQT
jgi:hypothetical protein